MPKIHREIIQLFMIILEVFGVKEKYVEQFFQK